MRWLTLLLFALLLWAPAGCKDSGKDHDAAQLEKCRVAMDEGEWTAAIEACSALGTDQANHLTAQAYLARGGAGMMTILTSVSGDSSGISTIFDAVPTTAAQVSDVLAGLGYLKKIEQPDSIVYAEGLLGSALLILKELTALLDLEIAADGSVTHCASGGGIDDCAFSLTLSDEEYTIDDVVAGVVPVTATYSGLGSTFYDGLCGQSNDATTDASKTVTGRDSTDTYDVVVTEDFTVNGCAATATSALAYNQWASAGLVDPPESLSSLGQLKFYEQIDTGENFSKTVSASLLTPITIAICNADAIPVTGAEDMAVNDCEILNFVTNLSLE